MHSKQRNQHEQKHHIMNQYILLKEMQFWLDYKVHKKYSNSWG